MFTKDTTKERFYNLSYDRIFKTVLINDDYRFLTMLLRDILEDNTLEVIHAEAIELPVTSVDEKIKILDVLAKVGEELFNIELNSCFDTAILERNLNYYFRLLNERFFRGDKEPKYRKVLQINLNIKNDAKYDKEEIRIYNLTRKELYYEDFKIININVVRYKKIWYDKIIKEGIRKHIYLTSLVADKEELENLGKIDGLVKEVGNKVFELNSDQRLRLELQQEQEAIITYKNSMKYAEEAGIEKGIEKNKIETAKEMLKKNISIKDIVEITKLSEEEILKIKQSNK